MWVELPGLGRPGQAPARTSGGLDAAGHLDPDARRVRAQPVDADSRPCFSRMCSTSAASSSTTACPRPAARRALPAASEDEPVRAPALPFSRITWSSPVPR
ncbi:MAG: hypothetical protein R3F43_01055 [bacterium]